MLTSTSCLLLLFVSVYLLAQCAVNFNAYRRSCDRASVAGYFNVLTAALSCVLLVVGIWGLVRGGIGA